MLPQTGYTLSVRYLGLAYQYFTIVYAAIQAWNGTLDKFIGDAAMAIFNAPAEHEDYIVHAVCGADDIIKSFEPIRQAFFKKYGTEIEAGPQHGRKSPHIEA